MNFGNGSFFYKALKTSFVWHSYLLATGAVRCREEVAAECELSTVRRRDAYFAPLEGAVEIGQLGRKCAIIDAKMSQLKC